jgi:hypothetical protein
MVARNGQKALPTGGLPTAPTLLDCYLEVLAKRGARDRPPRHGNHPSAEQSPASSEPLPAASAQADPFSK